MPTHNRPVENACVLDAHRAELIQNVTPVMPLADRLRSRGILHAEAYSEIRAAKTNQEKMRELFKALDSGGDRVKSAFYCMLKDIHPHLLQELEGQVDWGWREHLPKPPNTSEGKRKKRASQGLTLVHRFLMLGFLIPVLLIAGQLSPGWVERYWKAWDEENTHHTNVANAFGNDIYVQLRGPWNHISTAQIPNDSHVSFQTGKGQVNIMVYDDKDQKKIRIAKVFDSDISVIVKNNNGHPYFARSKYGKVWQEE